MSHDWQRPLWLQIWFDGRKIRGRSSVVPSPENPDLNTVNKDRETKRSVYLGFSHTCSKWHVYIINRVGANPFEGFPARWHLECLQNFMMVSMKFKLLLSLIMLVVGWRQYGLPFPRPGKHYHRIEVPVFSQFVLFCQNYCRSNSIIASFWHYLYSRHLLVEIFSFFSLIIFVERFTFLFTIQTIAFMFKCLTSSLF